MFEKLTRRAEGVATKSGVSRRRFLGRVGPDALALAGAIGAVLAAPRKARAGRPGGVNHCISECVEAGGDPASCYFICTFPG